MNSLLKKFTFSEELTDVIENCKGVSVPTSKAELYDMVFGPEHADVYDDSIWLLTLSCTCFATSQML